MEAELRKYQDIMRAASRGVFILGIWSAIKIILSSSFTSYVGGDTNAGDVVITVIAYLLVFAIDIMIRRYIWKGTMDESRGIRRGRLYSFALRFLALLYVVSIVVMIALTIYIKGDGIFKTLVSLAIDITGLSMLIETMRCVKTVRKLTEQKQAVVSDAGTGGKEDQDMPAYDKEGRS